MKRIGSGRPLAGLLGSLLLLGVPAVTGCGGGGSTIVPVVPSAPSTPPAPPVTWTLWGDSLTELGYPPFLADYTGQKAVNEGVASQTSTEIAVREGGVSTTVTVAGGEIPTSGSVQVTFSTGYSPAAFVSSNLVLGTIEGVEGTTVQDGSGNFIFTPKTSPSTAVTVAPGSPWKPILTGLNTGPVVIWVGRNNFNFPQQVLSDVAAMVATLPSPKNYVILGVINADYSGIEYKGDPGYNAIVSLNASLAAAYPDHYFDIRSYLVSHYDPSNPQDVIDFSHDVPPSSMKGINPYCAGTLTAPITSASQTQISISQFDLCRTLYIGSEKVEILSFSGGGNQPGIATVLRGYAGTTPATYPAGTPFTALDPLHTTALSGSTTTAKGVIAAQQTQEPK